METEEKRKRGAPKGNRNALKHGFYSKALREADQMDFIFAAGVEGIDEEIALLRHEIKKAISGGDDRNLRLLAKAAIALEKLVRAQYQINATQKNGLKDAIGRVINKYLVPLGLDAARAAIIKKISG